MLSSVKRHPLAVEAHFGHCLVLTYAVHHRALLPLIGEGLKLDRYGPFGFLAIALVQTQGLRPRFAPQWLGRSFMLSGYRVFTRFRDPGGRELRGLRILRSDTDRRSMVWFGNRLTGYGYELASFRMREDRSRLSVRVESEGGRANLRVSADLRSKPAALPEDSPFADLAAARKFAGPLPYTFSPEPESGSMIVVRGVRTAWDPQPVSVSVTECTFLDRPPFAEAKAVLASAFHMHGVPYRWERGIRYPVAPRFDRAPEARSAER